MAVNAAAAADAMAHTQAQVPADAADDRPEFQMADPPTAPDDRVHAPSGRKPGVASPAQPRVVALINQKGGVGKTTTTVNVGAALAQLGHRVLLIDLDPQGHLTLHVGLDPDQLEHSNYDLLTDDAVTAHQVMRQVGENLWVLPAEVNLAGAESELSPQMVTGRAQRILREKVEPVIRDAGDGRPMDYVLIDCPPSLGLLTIGALVLAREVVVPMQAHFLALQGLAKLLETVRLIRQSFNAQLTVAGVVLCMHESQTLLAGEVVANLQGFLEQHRDQDVPWRDARVYEQAIRRNIKLAECPSFGQTIFGYEPDCAGARDYRALAQQIHAHQPVRANG
jgi:chromosome partitioning protein